MRTDDGEGDDLGYVVAVEFTHGAFERIDLIGDVSPALQLIRDMREGKRSFDADEVAAVVEDCSRIRVPYSRLTVDFREDEFQYLRG